ncbi:MAG: hypothetical protein LBJ08_10860 [Bifidobacteriaceae bacterium]|jgi:hypothetical protein|nr:hypothetical protein [Bifidobacteriaceae bacterium]
MQICSVRFPRRVWPALAVLVAVLVPGAPACSSSERGSAMAAQRATAESYYACLADAGLPARIEETDNGGTRVDWPQEGYDILAIIPLPDPELYRTQSPAVYWIPGRSGDFEDENGTFERFMTEHQLAMDYGLEIDGVDHSATLAACHRQFPYQDPYAESDPAEELRGKQLLADSTNAWIACARDNGLPNLADVSPGKADNWLTSPTAIVPLSTTPDALRAILQACPNFDAEQAGKMEQSGFDAVAFRPDPAIQVDDANGEEEAARYAELTAILNEATDQFYTDQMQNGDPILP